MINEETRRKLRILNLGEFIDGIELQQKNPEIVGYSFDERFQQLVDSVYQQKFNGRVQRLLKQAKLRQPSADVHSFYYVPERPVTRDIVNELASCDYVENNLSIIVQGYTSSGKTFLGCALGKEACRHQYRTRYIRVPDLLVEYSEKSITTSGREKMLKKYAAYKVLILDEWLLKDISSDEREFLLELAERRYDATSTIFITLYPKEEWAERLGGGTYAESIVERFYYTAITVETGSMNMRKIFAPHLGGAEV